MQRRPRRAREPAKLGAAWLGRGPLRNALPPIAPLSADQQALERYEQPPLDPAIREALDAHVARRKVVLRDVDH